MQPRRDRWPCRCHLGFQYRPTRLQLDQAILHARARSPSATASTIGTGTAPSLRITAGSFCSSPIRIRSPAMPYGARTGPIDKTVWGNHGRERSFDLGSPSGYGDPHLQPRRAPFSWRRRRRQGLPEPTALVPASPTPACDRMRAAGQWSAVWNPFFQLDLARTDALMMSGGWIYLGRGGSEA